FTLTEQINGNYIYREQKDKNSSFLSTDKRYESKDSTSSNPSMKTTFTEFSECSMGEEELKIPANQPTIHNDAVSVAMQMTQPDDISTVPEDNVSFFFIILDLSQVLVIYTGGTIGMKNTHLNGYIPVPNYFTNTLAEMSRFHDQSFFDKSLRYDYDDCDDENPMYSNKIFIKDYWGIEDSGIMCISTVKMNAVEFNAFDSPNLSPLATVGININVNWAEIVRPSVISKFHAHKNLNRNVSNLRLFPGITESTVRALLAPPIEGVILETYGAGNAPDTRDDVMCTLKEAAARGVVIVNCTQCKKGTVTDLYATGKALTKVGVVPGNDMTPECALVKLSFLLGYRNEKCEKYSPETVRMLMTKNLRGELTVVAPRPRYTFHNRTHKIIQNMIGSLDSAMMNVQEKVLLEKSLYPILLCSAAGTDDLEGLQLLWDSYEGLVLNCIDYDEHGASVHMRDRFGHTPLYEAARNKRRDVISILREAGAHFNESELDDVIAAAKGDQELLRHFVDAGMDVNRTGFDHRTALHHAVSEGRVNTVQYLLSLPQIKVDTKDRWGRKPIDDAETNLGRMWGRDGDRVKELEEVVRLLREKMDKLEEYSQW
ncbi:13900_t:CDS:2, partial [Racocetra fulgida]